MSEIQPGLVTENSHRTSAIESTGLTNNLEVFSHIPTEITSSSEKFHVYYEVEEIYTKCSFCEVYCLRRCLVEKHVRNSHPNNEFITCEKCENTVQLKFYVSHLCIADSTSQNLKAIKCFFCDNYDILFFHYDQLISSKRALLCHIERSHQDKCFLNANEIQKINSALEVTLNDLEIPYEFRSDEKTPNQTSTIEATGLSNNINVSSKIPSKNVGATGTFDNYYTPEEIYSRCSFCNKFYFRRNDVKKHMKICQPDNNSMTCEKCGKSIILELSRYYSHQCNKNSISRNKKALVCFFCNDYRMFVLSQRQERRSKKWFRFHIEKKHNNEFFLNAHDVQRINSAMAIRLYSLMMDEKFRNEYDREILTFESTNCTKNIVHGSSHQTFTIEEAGITNKVEVLSRVQTEIASSSEASNNVYKVEEIYLLCSFCDTYCLRRCDIEKHVKTCHPNNDSIICKICGKSFITEILTYLSHKCITKSTSENQKALICFFCDNYVKVFTNGDKIKWSNRSLQTHIKSFHKNKFILSAEKIQMINSTLAVRLNKLKIDWKFRNGADREIPTIDLTDDNIKIIQEYSHQASTTEAARVTNTAEVLTQIPTENVSASDNLPDFYTVEEIYSKCRFCDAYCFRINDKQKHMSMCQPTDKYINCEKCRKEFLRYVAHKCVVEPTSVSNKVFLCFFCETVIDISEMSLSDKQMWNHIEYHHKNKFILNLDEIQTINASLVVKSKQINNKFRNLKRFDCR